MLRRYFPLSSALLLSAALFLSGCGAPSVASFMRPSSAPRGETPPSHIAEARTAWKILANPSRRSEWPQARSAYNRATAAAFDDLRRADPDWTRAAAKIGTRLAKRRSDNLPPEVLGTVFPASKVDVKRIGERNVTDGIGLPVVGWINDKNKYYQSLPFPPPTGVAVTATAVLNFDRGPSPTWEFRYPLKSNTVRAGGVDHKLAVDWSASQALYWWMSQLDKANIKNLLRPERLNREEGVFFGMQLEPDRIPVLFVHGLNSNPRTFALMLNELSGEEWFRRNYQVWLYYYPTGVPWMLSAKKFRGHFADATDYARRHGVRHLDDMIIVGHSMGGLITSASLHDPGTTAYSTFISKPIDQLDLRPDEREFLRGYLLWKPIDHVDRTVFMSTPHRGSPMADRFFANMVARLIKLPKLLTVDLADSLLRNTAAIADPMILDAGERARGKSSHFHLPTGIDSLSPKRPIFKVLPDGCPLEPGVELHSIIGDRGKGDTPNSTDGVVPYWSAHLKNVESEKIVPCGHGSTRNPQAIEEIKRILRLHLKESGR